MRRFLCWDLRAATFIGLVTTTVITIFALLLRALDLSAIIYPQFEISQGFQTPWRSHQWQAFLASDIILGAFHTTTIIWAVYMLFMVNNRHFVMYQGLLHTYLYYHCVYIFSEFSFSVFEFSFYGINTFRLAYVVFIWLFWLFRSAIYITFAFVMYYRIKEMEDKMTNELRFADEKRHHSYAYEDLH